MKKTTHLQLNKPDLDDRVEVNHLNQNADNIDEEIENLKAQMATKAPINSPKFYGVVLAPKLNSEEVIHEPVVTTSYVSEALEVENLDKLNAMRSMFIND